MALLLVIYRHPADAATPLEPLCRVTDQTLVRSILAHLYRSQRRCVCCGKTFVARDQRQRYCPPPPGVKESLCGHRWRQRQFRERHAARTDI